MKLIVDNDAVCCCCNKLSAGHCIDTIDHRTDFTSKEEFNNYLDAGIMKAMNLQENQIITLRELLSLSHLYLDNIETIYRGNDPEHTLARKGNVEKGIRKKQKELAC